MPSLACFLPTYGGTLTPCLPPCLPPRAAEAWFAQHGLPCPAGTAIAEHMLRIASDAADIRHLLLALDQVAPPVVQPSGASAPPMPPPAARSRSPRASSSDGGEAAGKASPPDMSPLGSGLVGLSGRRWAAADGARIEAPGGSPGAAGFTPASSTQDTEYSEAAAEGGKGAAVAAAAAPSRR